MMSHTKAEEPFEMSSLAAEITEEIVLLSNENPSAVYSELKGLRDKARHERAPEVAYLTLLHRKYAQVANSRKESIAEGDEPPASCLPWLHNDYGNSEAQQSGWGATETKLFRLRAVVAVLSLITFAVMSSAPYIENRDFKPNHHFHRGCAFKGRFSALFNFRGYQTIIAVGVVCFVHNGICMVYSALPVDRNGQKYIPGVTDWLGQMLKSQQRADFIASMCSEFCTTHGAFIAVLMDTLLLIMDVVSFAVSQYIFELAVPASVYVIPDNTYLFVEVDQYYTLSSCYLTYSHKTPACLDEGLNPTSKIRASLTLWFFATLVQLLCFLISWRKFQNTAVPGDDIHIQPDSPSFEQAQRLHGAGASTVEISADSKPGHLPSSKYSIVGDDQDELIVEEHSV